MDGFQIVGPDGAVEFRPGVAIALLRLQVVAGRVGVASVDADAHAALVVDAADDAGDMLELPAEVGALSGGVLDDGRRASFLKHPSCCYS